MRKPLSDFRRKGSRAEYKSAPLWGSQVPLALYLVVAESMATPLGWTLSSSTLSCAVHALLPNFPRSAFRSRECLWVEWFKWRNGKRWNIWSSFCGGLTPRVWCSTIFRYVAWRHGATVALPVQFAEPVVSLASPVVHHPTHQCVGVDSPLPFLRFPVIWEWKHSDSASCLASAVRRVTSGWAPTVPRHPEKCTTFSGSEKRRKKKRYTIVIERFCAFCAFFTSRVPLCVFELDLFWSEFVCHLWPLSHRIPPTTVTGKSWSRLEFRIGCGKDFPAVTASASTPEKCHNSLESGYWWSLRMIPATGISASDGDTYWEGELGPVCTTRQDQTRIPAKWVGMGRSLGFPADGYLGSLRGGSSWHETTCPACSWHDTAHGWHGRGEDLCVRLGASAGGRGSPRGNIVWVCSGCDPFWWTASRNRDHWPCWGVQCAGSCRRSSMVGEDLEDTARDDRTLWVEIDEHGCQWKLWRDPWIASGPLLTMHVPPRGGPNCAWGKNLGRCILLRWVGGSAESWRTAHGRNRRGPPTAVCRGLRADAERNKPN